MIKSIHYYLIIILLMATACNKQNKADFSKDLLEIRQKNIVDKRLKYWDVAMETKDGKSVLKGLTASESAFNDLRNFAKERKLDFQVELLPSEEFKTNQWGIVTISVCNIRGAARHSAELVTQALMGTPVKVFKKEGDWYLIQTPDRYFGWVDGAAIAAKTNQEMVEWKALEKVLYKNQYGFAYAGTNDKSSIQTDLVLADLLSVIEEKTDYYKILMADGREAHVKKDECISLDIWEKKRLSAEYIISTAEKFKGVPYLWGGTSAKMVDCSGFTKSVYYLHGVLLQRDASQQTLYGALVDTESGYEKLMPGDLVFFGKKANDDQKERVTHVGIVLGGQAFIHASGKVRVNSLDRNNPAYTEYYEKAFVRGRTIIDNIDGEGIEWVVDNAFYKEILP